MLTKTENKPSNKIDNQSRENIFKNIDSNKHDDIMYTKLMKETTMITIL